MSQVPFMRYGFSGDPALDASKRPPIELTSGSAIGVQQFEPSAPGPGFVANPIKTSVIVPLAIVANNIAASQIMNGAVTLTAGTSATLTTIQGNSVIDITGGSFDRAVTITGAASGTAVPFLIVGYDMYNQPQSETITGPTTATVTTRKTYRYIRSITTTGTTTSAFTIGTSDTIGFTLMVPFFDQVLIFFNGALITANTGFTAADQTAANTTTTGAVRGKYALQSASDGTKRLVLWTTVDPANANNMNTVYGVLPV